MNIRPLHDFVLVERADAADKSSGGIVIPEAAKAKSEKAKVLAVGPGKVSETGRRIEPSVKVHDVVVISKYCGVNFDARNENVLLVREEDILGVVVL